MISTSVISRLTDLKYQGKIKKYNISITSKNNEFGDVVKFFAQINKDDVIQKISFRATGCTAFIAVCSYFCEMIDGKTIASALKITQDKINALINLDERREHVFPIILNTFALLIKKYRKGVENKTIIPCDMQEESITTKKLPSNAKKPVKKTKSINKDNEIKVDLNTNKDIQKDINTKNVSSSKTGEKQNKTKSNSKLIKNKANKENSQVKDNIDVEVVSNNPDSNQTLNSAIIEDINNVHSDHLSNLHNLVGEHENVVVESNVNHSHDLSYLLQKVKEGNSHNVEHKTTITTTTTKTVSVLANIDAEKSNINEDKNASVDEVEIISSEPKKRRSFFDLFKKKK